ncbi:MAG TPA: amidase [Acidimicrobiia bacterium]|nr:amidase [Acidimicrobiia bacterium]
MCPSSPPHLDPIENIVQRHREGTSLYEAVESCARHIKKANSSSNAVIWSDPDFLDKEIARAKIQQSDSSHSSSLLGVPLLIKELDSAIAGTPNSWGNLHLKEIGYCDTFTATSVDLLRNAGAIIVGKTNNPELGLTVTTNSGAHGPCNNPLDTTRNSGGSSGGSAAAVASGMVSVATAGDGGGSARIPAAACGVYGYKPSQNLISLGPVIEEAWAGLVCKGLIASRLGDLVQVLDVMSQQKFASGINQVPQNLRIGIRTDGFGSLYQIDPFIVAATNKIAEFLQMSGHHVEVSSPQSYDDLSVIEPFLDIISYNTFLDITEVQRRANNTLTIDTCDPVTQYFYSQGVRTSLEQYNQARECIDPFTRTTHDWYKNFDVLITPTIGNIAPLHGEVEKDPQMGPFIYSGLCMPSNVAGDASLSIPVVTEHPTGLPAGIQLTTLRGNDALILRLGKYVESNYSDIFVTPIRNITN